MQQDYDTGYELPKFGWLNYFQILCCDPPALILGHIWPVISKLFNGTSYELADSIFAIIKI